MKFETALIVSIKKAKHKRLFVLQEPLICVDDNGRRWEVPEGFATDFASIPAVGRAFIPKAHQNAYAAVLHDYLYETQPLERRQCDKLFREALASPDCNTGPAKQWVMYKAVRSGGWHSWQNVQKRNLNLKTEARKMAEQDIVEEKGLFAKFIDWIKKTRETVDEELDELDDEARLRAKKLFRQANWPGIREREILFKNKVKKSIAFKIAYALIFLSSCITLYYWWGAMPDLTSKLLIGIGFFFANLLMPLWARMTFWQGGTWLQPVVNFSGLIILLFVAGASIVASAGLQGTKSDEVRSERAQQKVRYETKLAEAQALKTRIAELRAKTTRAPNEIKAELDGLLLTEPTPQSGCLSRDNFGSWSKRNCKRVTELRTEKSQASERVQLEAKASTLTFDDVPRVTVVDPQYEIAKRYTGVDRKTFNETKPLILAIMLELIFNGLTILLTITFGAEVREELRDRVGRLRRDLLGQAEAEATIIKNGGTIDGEGPDAPAPVVADPAPDPKPLSPAPVSVVEPGLARVDTQKLPDGMVVLPETKTETVRETTREVKSSTLASTGIKTTPFLEATEPEPVLIEKQAEKEPEPVEETTVIEIEPAPVLPVLAPEPEKEAPAPQHTITQAQDPVMVQEIEALKTKLAEQEAAKSLDDGDKAQLQAEVLKLRFANLSASRAVPTEVQQLAKYAMERFAYRVGSNIDLNFALKDYEAWCTKNGLAFNKPITDFRSLIETDLGLTVQDTATGAIVIINTEIRS